MDLLARLGLAGSGPSGRLRAGGAGLPIELRTSDASARAGVSALDGAPDPLPPPPGPPPKVAPTDALPAPADGPPRGMAAAARVAETLEATRPATVPAAMPAAMGVVTRLQRVVDAEVRRAAEQAPGQARRLPAEKHERADGEKDRPELVEGDLGSREVDARQNRVDDRGHEAQAP